ncbi:hypothetical protein AYI70_g7038 [Smittium culicis]|uniref:Uncharacterized protein n=1 Tax=Smittium culicis TaxID=133412 RepID=A0A1R1XMA3_9FUNG|nr:hypothetical protein AYI70_g7038 [Smittium culicis]
MDRRPHQGTDEGPDGHLGDRECPSIGNDEITGLSSTGGQWTGKKGKKGNWVGLQAMYPDLKLDLQDIWKMRMSTLGSALVSVEHVNRRPKIQKNFASAATFECQRQSNIYSELQPVAKYRT